MKPLLFFVTCLSILRAGSTAVRPNIIFLMTDDQGSADVGFANPSTPFITPNIDGIAGDAVRLRNYYVHPTCSPSRAALMTGRYAANVGLSLALLRGNPAGLDPRYGTLAEHLAGEGYRNYLVGKWHLGQSMAKYHPMNRGFHEFYGLLGGGFDYYSKQIGKGRYDFWRGFEPEWENTTHATELFNAEALRVVKTHVEQKGSEPFFLYLAQPAPHDPLMAPERHQKLCAHIKNHRRMLSCAMVAGVDEGFGELVQLLESTGQLDNTIIAFSVDNGGVPYAGALNYPLRAGKSTQYEGGVRAPGFIYAPKIIGANKDYKGLFHIADYLPTLAAMVNSTHPVKDLKDLDGINQLESLKAGASSVAEGARKSVHLHRDFDRDSHAYRRGPWKIIVGHHFIPMMYNRVFNETTSGWLVENGNWLDKTMELVLDGMDWLVGTEGTMFIQYFWWMVMDSLQVGGLAKGFPRMENSGGLFLEPYPSNLDKWRNHHTRLHPTVSLFNLEDDPQESVNLAHKHPDIVESLLAEAEDVVKKSPIIFRGDMIFTNGPKSPRHGIMSRVRSLGTRYPEVIPFGSYLPDDYPLTNEQEFIRMSKDQMPDVVIIVVKMCFVFILAPLYLLFLSHRTLKK